MSDWIDDSLDWFLGLFGIEKRETKVSKEFEMVTTTFYYGVQSDIAFFSLNYSQSFYNTCSWASQQDALTASLSKTSSVGSAPNIIKEKTFVPESYWHKKANPLGTPLEKYDHYRLSSSNLLEKSTIINDIGGRQKYRIDWTNHNRLDHSNPHLHEIVYGPQYDPIYGNKIRWDLK